MPALACRQEESLPEDASPRRFFVLSLSKIETNRPFPFADPTSPQSSLVIQSERRTAAYPNSLRVLGKPTIHIYRHQSHAYQRRSRPCHSCIVFLKKFLVSQRQNEHNAPIISKMSLCSHCYNATKIGDKYEIGKGLAGKLCGLAPHLPPVPQETARPTLKTAYIHSEKDNSYLCKRDRFCPKTQVSLL